MARRMFMSQMRVEKVQEFIRQEISALLVEGIKDPRVGFVTVTRVDCSRDLRLAKVYFSVMGSKDERKQSIDALNHAKGFIRSTVGKALNIRFTPELAFFLDESLDAGENIQRLLNEANKLHGGI